MRNIYIPYVFLSWLLVSLGSVYWLLQFVLFIYHDDHATNANLIIAQSLFVTYLAWQHIELFMFEADSKNNPHLQVIFLLLLSVLFLLQAWWFFFLVLLIVHSKILSTPLSHFIAITYKFSEKIECLINEYFQSKEKR